ncbi:histidine phosphatase family protein [Myceligenerans salitolerans]|uniref:Histidine phosphatase family protein n=1 Tax=Myceligenerans salitolerans TaxID=1230528 RepID=A0ABS3ID24_9MICO|nr:histidine phosphatase family protein [Myceligenerans salitolerans]MBO0610916.1 histidine phosphatase family protein [Myceligenerans salitolerans]
MATTDPLAHAPGYDTHVRPPGSVSRFDGALPLTVVLVRHGVTPMTEIGAYSGSDLPGPSLSTRGRAQAAQAADAVFRIGRDSRGLWPDVPRPTSVIASPMVRTQETAGAVGRRLGLPVTVREQFAECRFGDWEGLTAAQIEAGWPGELHLWHSTGTFVPPGGESYAQVGARVWDGMQELVDGGVGRTVVVVGHAAQIRTAVGQAMGAPASHWSRIRIPPASLSVLRLWADGASEITSVGFPTDV